MEGNVHFSEFIQFFTYWLKKLKINFTTSKDNQIKLGGTLLREFPYALQEYKKLKMLRKFLENFLKFR